MHGNSSSHAPDDTNRTIDPRQIITIAGCSLVVVPLLPAGWAGWEQKECCEPYI
jgi:hypothetical protein